MTTVDVEVAERLDLEDDDLGLSLFLEQRGQENRLAQIAEWEELMQEDEHLAAQAEANEAQYGQYERAFLN